MYFMYAMYVCMHACMHVCMYMYVRTYVCMHVCMHVCMYSCICIYGQIWMCDQLYSPSRKPNKCSFLHGPHFIFKVEEHFEARSWGHLIPWTDGEIGGTYHRRPMVKAYIIPRKYGQKNGTSVAPFRTLKFPVILDSPKWFIRVVTTTI